MLERWPQVCCIKIMLTLLPTNRFVSRTTKSMKFVVKWIPLRIRFRLRNTPPHQKKTALHTVFWNRATNRASPGFNLSINSGPKILRCCLLHWLSAHRYLMPRHVLAPARALQSRLPANARRLSSSLSASAPRCRQLETNPPPASLWGIAPPRQSPSWTGHYKSPPRNDNPQILERCFCTKLSRQSVAKFWSSENGSTGPWAWPCWSARPLAGIVTLVCHGQRRMQHMCACADTSQHNVLRLVSKGVTKRVP